MRRPGPTLEALKNALTYDPATGVFTHNRKWGTRPAGRVAGGLSKYGYVQISVDGVTYSAQQLAWLYMTGTWCANDIDHINRVRNDNRFENLRELTRSQNCLRALPTKRSQSGVKGVYPLTKPGTNKKWRASIKVNGRFMHLGNFYTLDDAISARRRAELRYA